MMRDLRNDQRSQPSQETTHPSPGSFSDGSVRFTPGQWRDFETDPPSAAGIYEWRVPSRAVAGLIVRSIAHFRERNAGYSKRLSPEFDYWDGWKLHVPAGTQWRLSSEAGLKEGRQTLVCVEGAEFEPCPFCKSVPMLKGIERSGGGVMIGSDAHRFNTFWLECCGWAKSPHYGDPRKLAESRRAALSAAHPLPSTQGRG